LRTLQGISSATSQVFEKLNSAAADATLGLVVGSGSGAVAPRDYALGTLIAHGTGGQLSHGVCSVGAVVPPIPYAAFYVNRAIATYTNCNVQNRIGERDDLPSM
jgi:hypothetical protein